MAKSVLLPNGGDNVIIDAVKYTEPTFTYNIEYGGDKQIKGYVDEIEAMKQAIYKIINTERYQYLIYSWNYGIELADLFGQPIPYVYAELERRIKEALLNDDRIVDVFDFNFSNDRGDVSVDFSVKTIYGTITDIRKVVNGIV